MAPPKEPTHQAVTMRHVPGPPGKVYYPLALTSHPTPHPPPSPSHLLLHPTHLSLNHRDLFLRQSLYPSPSFTTPLLSDATCVPLPPSSQHPSLPPSALALLSHPRLLINPATGWLSSPSAPESSSFEIYGGTKGAPLGLAAQTVAVPAAQCEICPPHLSSPEAAALPLVGLTAWRALVSKSGIVDVRKDTSSGAHTYHGRGRHLLVTGCGGGVAGMVVLLAVAMGCEVWVTGGSERKVSEAVARLGARAGVVYREEKWERRLKAMLPEERPFLDAIIDGAGGDVVKRTAVGGGALLKQGGVVVSYGMTVGPSMPLLMGAVLRNVEVRGSTMGSRREFGEMVRFVGEMGIRPVVSRVERGRWGGVKEEEGTILQALETLFDDMKHATQFGKLVLEVVDDGDDKEKGTMSKL